MAMLVTFILFGAVLSSILGDVDLLPALALAGFVIFLLRPPVLALVLAKARMSWAARGFICWFGPRGLNSLLLALLVVLAGVPGGELLLATMGVVVLASVSIHDASAPLVSGWYGRKVAAETLEEERENTAAAIFGIEDDAPECMSVAELEHLLVSDALPILLDARLRSSYESDGVRIPGGVRVRSDEVLRWAADRAPDQLVVAYCT
jgi:NhaP-type Na+/H+ or K+/H+ antiporter